MRLVALLLVVMVMAAPARASSGPAESVALDGRIPGARAIPTCAAAGPYWPTMTLAIQGRTAWVACKEQARLVRVRLPDGARTGTTRLAGQVVAVAAGLGSVWALDTAATLYRIAPRTGRVVARIELGARAPYNVWIGSGSVWVADDRGGVVLRVSPAAAKVVARIPVGDGPADMVFRGRDAWVVTHRDNTVYRVQTQTNVATRLGTVPAVDAAAERLALLGESLWVTGRGMGLVELDPTTGAVRRTVDVLGTGIDVVATAGALWIPVRSQAVDRTGFPTMEALRRVGADGSVSTVATSRGRVDVHGLAAGLGALWIADNTNGRLYALATWADGASRGSPWRQEQRAPTGA